MPRPKAVGHLAETAGIKISVAGPFLLGYLNQVENDYHYHTWSNS